MALLSPEDIQRLEAKIDAVRQMTSADLRVAITGPAWLGINRKARKIFDEHRLASTPERNAVLVVVDPKNHEIAIYGDEGISSRTDDLFFDEVRDAVVGEFRAGRPADGLSLGIRLLGEELVRLYPGNGQQRAGHATDGIIHV
ncbi:MAG: TPM domain-containing protein [Thermoanaerobaculia bacterium]